MLIWLYGLILDPLLFSSTGLKAAAPFNPLELLAGLGAVVFLERAA